jgi:hypothetical protein
MNFEKELAEIANYEAWHLKILLEDKEKWLYTLEFCTCDACMEVPPEETAKWIDETRQIIAQVRTELEKREIL